MDRNSETCNAATKPGNVSAVKMSPGENPYEALIVACNNEPEEIQRLYSKHRETRNAQQQQKFLSADFTGLSIDTILLRLEKPQLEPGFTDERNCLVFWARPPDHILKLAAHLQMALQKAAPDVWLMPTHKMHMTTLEVNHSRTPEEIASLVTTIRPKLSELASFTFQRRTRLVKPMISYDLSAFALSFLPAAGEEIQCPVPLEPPIPGSGANSEPKPGQDSNGTGCVDAYTYHHLRRDLFATCQSAGLSIASRYVVPSAHITLGRYLNQEDHGTSELRKMWIKKIDELNKWLQDEVWAPHGEGYIGEWIVGQERGLDIRSGQLWYGGGRTIQLGEGF